MTTRDQVYKCDLCGNIVEVMHAAGGKLVCCGQPMGHQNENTTEAAVEKHIPTVSFSSGELAVKVGSTSHPMADDHYIEWIELVNKDTIYRQHLSPGGEPSYNFKVEHNNYVVRAYCNLHGLWKA
ncbi:MAG: desulfoferrodoxin [Bacteriovoracaceae bacterium]|nr:desulfoferrodoxin [Bacteriovoracaceae bacterium]